MAAPVVPQSWSNFEQALAAQGRNFEGIKGATDRNATITAVMGNAIPQLDRDEINTEWARRVDAPAAANQELQRENEHLRRENKILKRTHNEAMTRTTALDIVSHFFPDNENTDESHLVPYVSIGDIQVPEDFKLRTNQPEVPFVQNSCMALLNGVAENSTTVIHDTHSKNFPVEPVTQKPDATMTAIIGNPKLYSDHIITFEFKTTLTDAGHINDGLAETIRRITYIIEAQPRRRMAFGALLDTSHVVIVRGTKLDDTIKFDKTAILPILDDQRKAWSNGGLTLIRLMRSPLTILGIPVSLFTNSDNKEIKCSENGLEFQIDMSSIHMLREGHANRAHVFECQQINSETKYLVKLFPHATLERYDREVKAYQQFSNQEGFPRIYATGYWEVNSTLFFVMVVTPVGIPLLQAWEMVEPLQTKKTTLLEFVGDRLSQKLNIIHKLGLFHGDISPGNIIITTDDPIDVHLIDWENSSSDKTPIKPSIVTATIPFCSIRVHRAYNSYQQTVLYTRDDDLQSLFYSLVHLAFGVPWLHLSTLEAINGKIALSTHRETWDFYCSKYPKLGPILTKFRSWQFRFSFEVI